ncbi:hypothetical protein ASG01_15480 [Chryseobacterium sp. Leaf180]|uniref:hypothetical protein n=1 Tax=Chryseobacterium sp. Leaf180 TaxID=1736289 RepID=UPI0006FDC9A3|nr:hypothetical protein [Chryseobacterium sp. Leaf180]KQR94183.1 hypothetical protein ASG01_15480 [Chryseobacterium sp. Leaf180]
MTKIKLSFLVLTLALLTSCDFIKDSFTFKDKTEAFVESLMKKDYDKCISQMALESEMGKNTNIDTLKLGLDQFRSLVERNFGNNKFEYSLMKSEKKRSTIESQNTPPNTTLALIEFSNDKEFGVFQVLFDDKSKKILNINTLEVKAPKPNMLLFWLFGLLPLTVLIFNIFVIRKIKKSTLTKKWLKYLAVILLNVPAISYAAVEGLSFKLLNFQILFGVSFSAMGYLGSIWTFGIPLGGIYWLWKLKQRKDAEIFDTQIENSYTGSQLDNTENETKST